IPPLDKLRVAQDVLAQVDKAHGELPDVAAAFESRPHTDEYRSLLSALEDQLDRAVTDAFSIPFLLAAGLALAALVPVWLGRGEPRAGRTPPCSRRRGAGRRTARLRRLARAPDDRERLAAGAARRAPAAPRPRFLTGPLDGEEQELGELRGGEVVVAHEYE